MGLPAMRSWFLFLAVLFVAACQNPFYREAGTQGLTIQLNILQSSQSSGRMIVASADTIKLELFQTGVNDLAMESYEKVLSAGEMTLSHTFHGLVLNTEYLIKAQVLAQGTLIHEGETTLILEGDDEPIVLTLLPAKSFLSNNGIIPEKTLQTLNMMPGFYKAYEMTYNSPGTYEILVDGVAPTAPTWDVILQYPGGNYEKKSEFIALTPGKLTFWLGNSSPVSKSPSIFWGNKAPLDPTGLTLTPQPDPLITALLTWTAPQDPDLDHYEITLTGPIIPSVPNVPATDPLSVPLGISDGDYTVSVTAVDKSGLKSPGTSVVLPFVAFVPVTAVALNASTANLNIGSTTVLIETLTPANATNQTVAWNSSDPAVATVDGNGLVTALVPGTTTVTVTTQDGTKIATCVVTVSSLLPGSLGITLTLTNPTVPVASFDDGAGNAILAVVTQGSPVTARALGQTLVDWWIDGTSLNSVANPLTISTVGLTWGNHSLTCVYTDGTNQYSENFSFTVEAP